MEVLRMKSWYVITNKRNAFQWVTERLTSIGVEFFSPTHVELRKRPDRPSCRKIEKQLFSGYLFLRFDPDELHTTTIADIPGVQGFVRYGGQPSTVRNELVDALRKTLLLRTDRTLSCIEYRNLPSDLMRALHLIVEMRSETRRKAALYALLEKEAMSERFVRLPGALICSALHAS